MNFAIIWQLFIDMQAGNSQNIKHTFEYLYRPSTRFFTLNMFKYINFLYRLLLIRYMNSSKHYLFKFDNNILRVKIKFINNFFNYLNTTISFLPFELS